MPVVVWVVEVFRPGLAQLSVGGAIHSEIVRPLRPALPKDKLGVVLLEWTSNSEGGSGNASVSTLPMPQETCIDLLHTGTGLAR